MTRALPTPKQLVLEKRYAVTKHTVYDPNHHHLVRVKLFISLIFRVYDPHENVHKHIVGVGIWTNIWSSDQIMRQNPDFARRYALTVMPINMSSGIGMKIEYNGVIDRFKWMPINFH